MAQLPRIDAKTRRQIAEFLPVAIENTISSYQTFFQKKLSSDTAKAFTEHHGAAKVALAHLQLFVKMTTWAYEPDQLAADAELAALIAEAEAELAGRDDPE